MRQPSPFEVHVLPIRAAAILFCSTLFVSELLRLDLHAQPATYDAQLSYYDAGAPIPIAAQNFADRENFTGSSGYSSGFRDNMNVTPYVGDFTQALIYVGNYGGTDSFASQSSVESVNDFQRIDDGLGDNGISGAVFIVTNGPDGSTQISTVTDFGDLHQFNVGFDQVATARQSNVRSFGTGWVYWVYEEGGVRTDPDRAAADQTERAVKNRPVDPPGIRRGTGSRTIYVSVTPRSRAVPDYSQLAAGHRGTGVALATGYQEFGLFDRFRFDADGGIMGRTYSDTRANNMIAGPYSGLVAHTSIGPITFYGHALGILGFNDGDLTQSNGIGAELVPGALNRLLYAQPTYSQNRTAIDDVSPTGVLWAEAGLQLTEQSSLKFAWSAVYINNILMAEDRVRYYLPDMGFRDPGEQDYFQQMFFCGIEMVR